MTGPVVQVGNWRELMQMAETAPSSLSRGPESEIIGDYTHPSPFLQKINQICLIPLSGVASEGALGWLASITGLKKAQNIRNQEEPWPGLQGRRPVGQRTRGAGSDRAEGDATWPQIDLSSGDDVLPRRRHRQRHRGLQTGHRSLPV